MLAAPGVPRRGSDGRQSAYLAPCLRFGETAIALMIALYMAQDSFRYCFVMSLAMGLSPY